MENFLLDILFPKFCINCKREGSYLCEDCLSLIDIFDKQYPGPDSLDGLFCAASYENKIIKNLIDGLENSTKAFARPIANIILAHFLNSDKLEWILSTPSVLVPVPEDIKTVKKRGYNKAEEIAKELSLVLKFPIEKKALGASKRILLVDDYLITGSTMEKCSKNLAKEVWGIVLARG